MINILVRERLKFEPVFIPFIILKRFTFLAAWRGETQAETHLVHENFLYSFFLPTWLKLIYNIYVKIKYLFLIKPLQQANVFHVI